MKGIQPIWEEQKVEGKQVQEGGGRGGKPL